MSRARGSGGGAAEGLSVVHLGVLPDPAGREPDALLDAWPTLVDTAEAVARRGVRVRVVQAAARDAALEREGVAFRFVRTPAPSRLRRRAGLWATPLGPGLGRAVAEGSPRLVHVHGLAFPRHLALLRGAVPAAARVVQDHADRPPPPWLRPLHRRGLAGTAAVLFTARDQAEPFRAAGLLGGARVHEVPEATSRFTPGDRGRARLATGLHGDPCLLWLGNLDPNKDPLTVLDAVARAVGDLPDLHLWCAFRGTELLAAVEARVAGDARLRERVHLLGRQGRGRVEALIRSADFLVQGSWREGSGYAVIEALACGTVPLVTDIPSFRTLTGGEVGALVPPGDAAALARALVEWSGRDRAGASRAARQRFEAYLSMDALGRRLVEVYEAVLRDAAAAPG